MVGHAVDYRIIFGNGKKCGGDCIGSYLSATKPSEKGNSIRGLFQGLKSISGLRTGDTIPVKKADGTKTFDYPHIDSGVNVNNPQKYSDMKNTINN